MKKEIKPTDELKRKTFTNKIYPKTVEICTSFDIEPVFEQKQLFAYDEFHKNEDYIEIVFEDGRVLRCNIKDKKWTIKPQNDKTNT